MRVLKERFLICIILFFLVSVFSFSNPVLGPPQALVLDVTEQEFWTIARSNSWNNNHIAISDRSVTSINFMSEFAVYSKDDKFLFYIPKLGMTRSVLKGYLQLALYDRSSREVTMLETIPLQGVKVIEPVNDIILVETMANFRTLVRNVGWDEYLLPQNLNRVNNVNAYRFVSVYTSDGFFLFDVDRDQAGYIRETGALSLAKMTGQNSFAIVARVEVAD